MELNDYQKMAQETAIYPNEFKVIYPALGLAGEAGEAADKVKKVIRDTVILRDGNGKIILDEEKRHGLFLELGDVLWYVQALAFDLGYSLEEVAQANIDKLFKRKEEGKISGSGDYR